MRDAKMNKYLNDIIMHLRESMHLNSYWANAVKKIKDWKFNRSLRERKDHLEREEIRGFIQKQDI